MKSRITATIKTATALALAFGLATAASAKNVVEKLSSRAEFSTLVEAVTAAGLVETLEGLEDITIFAPSNAAFSKIPEEDLNALLADREALIRVLTYHVAGEELRFRELQDGPLDTLLEGSTVDVSVKSFFGGWFRQVSIDDVSITRANISASNGVIHRIESVLDPATETLPSILKIAAGDDNFSILADLVVQAGFDRALDSEHLDLTVFAPTNAAFEALGEETLAAVQADRRLLRQILRNHIVLESLNSDEIVAAGGVKTALRKELPASLDPSSGTGLAIDGKPIDLANLPASNGIVHVVGGVLVPEAPKSLVTVASERSELSTFVSVLGLAELADTFDSTSKWPAFTIFAPTDAAFSAVPSTVLDELLANPTTALADVLKLHVVSGKFTADDLYDGQILHSLSGGRLEVSIGEEGIRINNALVETPNLGAENGVIHIVGNVISPNAFTVADFVGSKSYLSTLNAAVGAAKLGEALDDETADYTLFAPLNYAFNRLPDGLLDSLLEEPEGQLQQILLYHVLGESLSASELTETASETTLQGADVRITSFKLRFWGWRQPFTIINVNGNRVISADIEVDNGIIHLIPGVLLPPAEN